MIIPRLFGRTGGGPFKPGFWLEWDLGSTTKLPAGRVAHFSITKFEGAPFLAFFARSGAAKLIQIINPPGPSSQYKQIFRPYDQRNA
jgi:hypothetical protein